MSSTRKMTTFGREGLEGDFGSAAWTVAKFARRVVRTRQRNRTWQQMREVMVSAWMSYEGFTVTV
jgi:hypothetical protein